MKVSSASQKNLNSDLTMQGARRSSAGARAARPAGKLQPTIPDFQNKTVSRGMTADRPIKHLLKGKKSPPPPAKPKKAEELKTTAAQDEATDL
jgi:hypothetical protein